MITDKYTTCPHDVFEDAEVIKAFDHDGYTSLTWKCPDCGRRKRVTGTRWSKTAYPIRRVLGIWIRAN